MKIKQLYSAFGSHFKTPFLKKYNMVSYHKKSEPVVLFGCYGNQIEIAFNNTSGIVRIIWAGSDCWNFIKYPEWVEKMKNNSHIKHIAISKFIKDDLTSVGIPCELIPIVPHDNSDITPHPPGDAIYAYRSAYNPKLFRTLQKELPYIEFIDARHTTYPRKELMEIYKRCFMGLRFTRHDGCSNTVMELGLMGRRCFWNGGSPSSIPFDLKNTGKIIEDIINEYNNRKTTNYTQTAKEVNDYLDVGENFLEY